MQSTIRMFFVWHLLKNEWQRAVHGKENVLYSTAAENEWKREDAKHFRQLHNIGRLSWKVGLQIWSSRWVLSEQNLDAITNQMGQTGVASFVEELSFATGSNCWLASRCTFSTRLKQLLSISFLLFWSLPPLPDLLVIYEDGTRIWNKEYNEFVAIFGLWML